MCKETAEKCMKVIEKNAERNGDSIAAPIFEYEYIAYAADGHQAMRTLEEIDSSMFKTPQDSFMELVVKLFEEGIDEPSAEYDAPNVKEFEREIADRKKKWKAA